MIGLQRQRLAIERFGLRESARLMMGEAGGKKTGNAQIRRRRAGWLDGRIGGAALFAVHILVLPVDSREAPIALPGNSLNPANF